MDDRDDSSFRLDRNARSFAPSDFGLGDVPWIMVTLAVVLGVLTGLGYIVDRVGQWLPPHLRLIALGFVLGYLVALRVSDCGARRSRARSVGRDDPDA